MARKLLKNKISCLWAAFFTGLLGVVFGLFLDSLSLLFAGLLLAASSMIISYDRERALRKLHISIIAAALMILLVSYTGKDLTTLAVGLAAAVFAVLITLKRKTRRKTKSSINLMYARKHKAYYAVQKSKKFRKNKKCRFGLKSLIGAVVSLLILVTIITRPFLSPVTTFIVQNTLETAVVTAVAAIAGATVYFFKRVRNFIRNACKALGRIARLAADFVDYLK